jgi:hypothetical protein
MLHRFIPILILWLVTTAGAAAATVTVAATDDHGKHATNAVVSLAPGDNAQIAAHAPEGARVSFSIPLLAPDPRGMNHMHMDY